MKLNNECARKVLLEVEKLDYGETIPVAKLQEKIPEFTIEEVLNIVTHLNRDNYLNMVDKMRFDDNDVLRDHKIKSLTEKGYKSLDLIRNDDLWEQIKTKVDNFDELSFYTIFDIANKIINVKYNELFDLPKELFIENNKW